MLILALALKCVGMVSVETSLVVMFCFISGKGCFSDELELARRSFFNTELQRKKDFYLSEEFEPQLVILRGVSSSWA